MQAGITKPPVDPADWCRDRERIRVHLMHLNGECDGLLVFRGGKFHLFYDPDPHRGRFTFAHEVGHYLIDEHHAAIRSGVGPPKCFTGFVTDVKMEREADWFAAGLLMPRFLFARSCPDPNIKDIRETAKVFDVSLTSAILRTITFTDIRTAVVVTVAGKIKWYFPSEGMKLSGIRTANIGCQPHPRSKTAAVYANLRGLPSEPIDGGKCSASDWFATAYDDPDLWEEVLPVPAFDQVITLLTFYDD